MWKRVSIILVLGAAALLWAYLYGPAARQREGIEQAESLRTQFEPLLAKDPRFADVTLSSRTNPALVVLGTVPNQAALADLRNLIPAAPPPAARFSIEWRVTVAPAKSGPTREKSPDSRD
ncbi:MAG TPA: hypothetical protein VEA69_00085 [Tepidisphaeraceae bacterium]|nr:hypothetical protein [Tepidisphaeraceae bacterium]